MNTASPYRPTRPSIRATWRRAALRTVTAVAGLAIIAAGIFVPEPRAGAAVVEVKIDDQPLVNLNWLTGGDDLSGPDLDNPDPVGCTLVNAFQWITVFMCFRPDTVTVQVGDTVNWTNVGNVPHTVTDEAGTFDSGRMVSGGTWQHTFSAPGTYNYFCEYHASKQEYEYPPLPSLGEYREGQWGKVIVEAASSSTSSTTTSSTTTTTTASSTTTAPSTTTTTIVGSSSTTSSAPPPTTGPGSSSSASTTPSTGAAPAAVLASGGETREATVSVSAPDAVSPVALPNSESAAPAPPAAAQVAAEEQAVTTAPIKPAASRGDPRLLLGALSIVLALGGLLSMGLVLGRRPTER